MTQNRFSIFTVLATIALISAIQPATAQDAVNSFGGAYLGAHGGYVSGSATFESAPYIAVLSEDVPIPGRSDKFNLSGWQGGIHSGYNYVNEHNYLFGIEGDLTYLGIEDTVVSPVQRITENGEDFDLSHRSELDMDWQGTIRGRAGYISNNTLFFGTAGIAFLNVDWREQATVFDDQIPQTFVQNHSDSKTLTGFAIGGGVEHALTPEIIIGADYLYENFGDFKVPFGHATPAQQGNLDDIDVHKVSLRLSYRF